MREIHDHKVNPASTELRVLVIDEPGSGGANHLYLVDGFSSHANPSIRTNWAGSDMASAADHGCIVVFQNGPIAEAGVNGVTHEALLAIVADRLRCFQAGPYACTENGLALIHVEEALAVLQLRTRARVARGVEGTHKV
jgi:hypothetical protein